MPLEVCACDREDGDAQGKRWHKKQERSHKKNVTQINDFTRCTLRRLEEHSVTGCKGYWKHP